MAEHNTLARVIDVDAIHRALNLVTFRDGSTVEAAEPSCDWPQLCHENFCRYPRYRRDGAPVGLTATVLVELGYPVQVLKELDAEYEVGELLHPGVKIAQSRNPALVRIDSRGVALLSYLQDNQKMGWSWSDVAVAAFRPRWLIRRLDSRKRPWLY